MMGKVVGVEMVVVVEVVQGLVGFAARISGGGREGVAITFVSMEDKKYMKTSLIKTMLQTDSPFMPVILRL